MWNGEYYVDWIYRKKQHNTFTTDGNTLAILFGVASPHKAKKIQFFIEKHGLSKGFTTKTNYPKYKKRHIYSLFFPINIHDYHNGLEWLWIGCIDAVSKYIMGKKEEAHHLMEKLAKKIQEHNGVYEVYHSGKPVKRLFYKSEEWFAWSSGLFVWACHELNLITEVID